MDLTQLPWWGKKDHFYDLSREELNNRFDKFPLNKTMVKSFVDNYVSTVWMDDCTYPDCWGGIYREAPFYSLNFQIWLNAYFPLEELSSTLIHESIHGIYGVNSKGVEDIIIGQEEKFYSKNKDFSTRLLEKNLGKFKGTFSEEVFNRNKELIKNN